MPMTARSSVDFYLTVEAASMDRTARRAIQMLSMALVIIFFGPIALAKRLNFISFPPLGMRFEKLL